MSSAGGSQTSSTPPHYHEAADQQDEEHQPGEGGDPLELVHDCLLSVPTELQVGGIQGVLRCHPTFVADVDGTYVATLVINDGASDREPEAVETKAEAP